MNPPVVTKDPTAVEIEVQAACLATFPNADPLFVPRAFGWAIECFMGNYRDYQAVDARYHDFEHTLQGTLCLARLLRARQAAGAHPQISQRTFQLALVAILLHDTGYLKKRDDTDGTGAKYTVTHVNRSAEFAAQLLQEKGFPPGDIKAVQNMISCTGVNAALSVIPFQSEAEKVAGFALGTADLLGQMAAEDYVDKLPTLYAEFAEAARHTKDRTHFIAMFSSAEDLMRKTPTFWEKIVRVKLDRDFGGQHCFLKDPYPTGPNPYFQRIALNLERLRLRITPAN
jgi:predicted metal-dependent HD superfamily phosphohydrolase